MLEISIDAAQTVCCRQMSFVLHLCCCDCCHCQCWTEVENVSQTIVSARLWWKVSMVIGFEVRESIKPQTLK